MIEAIIIIEIIALTTYFLIKKTPTLEEGNSKGR